MKIEVKNASYSYTSEAGMILNQINLEAVSGDIVAILGPNGAGKTTLLKCIVNLLKWQNGESLINGKSIRGFSQKELWRIISYVPQARQVFSAYSVEETVLLGRSSRIGAFSMPSEKDMEITEKVLKELNLEKLKGKKCSEISGGELQMVLIARAMAAQPEILILDEPESNLDFRNQLIVLETMSRLAADGMVCIFNTHFPAHALRRANKALLLFPDGGYLFGNTPEIVTEENIQRAFGVEAVIGEVETPENIFRDVVAVSVSEKGKTPDIDITQSNDTKAIACISIIISDSARSEQINTLLHEYRNCLVGRMGLPLKRSGLNIINLTLEARPDEIRQLTHKLNLLPDVSVKATYAKEIRK